MNNPAIIDNDIDGIQSVGQAAEDVVKKAGQAMVERKEAAAPVALAEQRTAMTPMEMVGRALEMGVSAEILKQMMDLRDREDADRARKAFTVAFSAFKAEAVTIVRNKKITDGPLKGKSYAELFSFVDAVTPALSKHGLSASWDITRDEKDWIEVTCIIEHVLGHTKRVAMGGPPDTGGAKNPIQSRASTVSYLERHTLKAACGLAEQGDDKDGNGRPVDAGPISAEQVATILDLVTETGTEIDRFCDFLKIGSVAELHSSQYGRAISALEAKRRKSA